MEPPKTSVALFDEDDDDIELSDYDIAKFRKLLKDPTRLPPEFVTWMLDQMTRNAAPFDQQLGGKSFRATGARIDTEQTTTSVTYTDLATVGPTISDLPGGRYIVFFGATLYNGGAGASYMGVKVNSTEATDTIAIRAESAERASSSSIFLTDLPLGSNTLQARYRDDGVTAGFSRRFLIALKYANL